MNARHALTLIAAVARNGVIGRSGGMPWRLPSDLAHFGRATTGHPVLMGRKTFDTIGRALPGREVVVVSADPAFTAAGVHVARTLDEGLAQADRAADRLDAGSIMVAGGGTIYRALIAHADTLLITAVDATPDGDVWFPPIDPTIWTVANRRGPLQQPGDDAPYTIERWTRCEPLSPDGNGS